jgi:hypothetical protein
MKSCKLELLKRHLPNHESDHILNIVHNIHSGGTCREDIELRRKDKAYLNALGAQWGYHPPVVSLADTREPLASSPSSATGMKTPLLGIAAGMLFVGLTRFTFKGFVLGSLIGFIPFSLHNVYLGSITADLASLSRGEVERSPLQWAFYGLGFVATIVALLYFSNLARRALAAYSLESGRVQGGKPVPEAGTAAGAAKGS